MYLSHYKLKSKPFQISTNPAFLWLGSKHKEALAVLKYGILDNRGFLLMTGDVGTGKTTLINALMNSLGDDVIVASVQDPGLDRFDFFTFIADAFQMEKTFKTKGDFLIQFREYLNQAYRNRKKVLLIVDEAQRLSHDLLEEVRLLSNIERPDIKLLNIFFIGQNEFKDTLVQPENRALRQRITINYNIDSLTEKETGEYIQHRLKVAGCNQKLFTTDAVHEVFLFSNGYPRLINIICDTALLTGYVKEASGIDGAVVRECADELQITGHKIPHGPDGDSMPGDAVSIPEPVSEISSRAEKKGAGTAVEQNSREGTGNLSPSAPAENDKYSRPSEIPGETRREKRRRQAIHLTALMALIAVLLIIVGVLYYRTGFDKPFFNMLMLNRQALRSDVSEPDMTPSNPLQPLTPQQARREPQESGAAIDGESDTEQEKPADPLPLLSPRKYTVRFSYNSNDFSVASYPILDKVAQTAIQHPAATVTIKGYTDALGDYHYNKKLSLFRANLVKSYLVGKGVSFSKIQTAGMGPEKPLQSNETAAGRSANRRVEIEVQPSAADSSS